METNIFQHAMEDARRRISEMRKKMTEPASLKENAETRVDISLEESESEPKMEK